MLVVFYNKLPWFVSELPEKDMKLHTLSCFRLLTILSRPLKAPDAMNKIFVVSTAMVSPLIFRELRSGTFTVVPSRIFRRPLEKQKNVNNDKLKKKYCNKYLAKINLLDPFSSNVAELMESWNTAYLIHFI